MKTLIDVACDIFAGRASEYDVVRQYEALSRSERRAWLKANRVKTARTDAGTLTNFLHALRADVGLLRL